VRRVAARKGVTSLPSGPLENLMVLHFRGSLRDRRGSPPSASASRVPRATFRQPWCWGRERRMYGRKSVGGRDPGKERLGRFALLPGLIGVGSRRFGHVPYRRCFRRGFFRSKRPIRQNQSPP